MRVEFDFWLEINNLRDYSLSTDEIVDSVEYFFTDLLPKYQLASEGWRKGIERQMVWLSSSKM